MGHALRPGRKREMTVGEPLRVLGGILSGQVLPQP